MKCKNEWDIDIETIGPYVASMMLRQNEGNRRIRPGLVRRYALSMQRGEWILTPEPIVIADDGNLMNAQHRLSAVVQADVTLPFLIVRNVNPLVFRALDRGATRSAADALHLDNKLAQVARLAARVMTASIGKTWTVTDGQIEEMADLLCASHESLMGECPSSSRILSTAGVRLAACISDVFDGNGEYSRRVYRDLVLQRFSDLPPIAHSLIGQVVNGAINTGGGTAQDELLVRAIDVFDPSKASIQKIIIRDRSEKLRKLAVRLAGRMTYDRDDSRLRGPGKYTEKLNAAMRAAAERA